MRRRAGAALLALAIGAAGFALNGLRQRRAVQLGADLYLRGRGAGGRAVTAVVAGDVPVEGTMFTCVSCHLPSGLGSTEGQVATPAVNGQALFQPLQTRYKGVPVVGAAERRPAYDETSLARLLRSGVDPTGRVLSSVMPRYQLTDDEARALRSYLQTLSATPAPGVTAEAITLATIVDEEAPAEEREALLFTLRKFVALKNSQVARPGEARLDNRSARMAAAMASSARDSVGKALELQVWTLAPPRSTWRSQLERHAARAPVFAVLSGVAAGDWGPLHAFCEAQAVPCLFPVTALPTLDEGAKWTLYVSRGLFLEGELVARHLASGSSGDLLVVQVRPPGPEAAALAAGVAAGLQAGDGEGARVTLVTVSTPDDAPRALATAGPRATALLWWGTAASRAALEATLRGPTAPERAFVSGTRWGEAPGFAADVRARVELTWPWRLPADDAQDLSSLARLSEPGAASNSAAARAACTAFAATQLFSLGLMELKGNYNQEALLERIATLKDQRLPCFERLSFGAGQRFASKGAFLVSESADGGGVEARTAWLTR